jgi:hypothetical protein
MSRDRRRVGQTRYPLQPPVAVETQDATGKTDYGACRDVSVSGVCLWQKRPMGRGSAVALTLNLRPGVALSMAGRVVWAEPNDHLTGWVHGIRFSADLHQSAVMEATKRAAQSASSVLPTGEGIGAV